MIADSRPRLLITGAFWHHEFSGLVNGLSVPATLVRPERLATLQRADREYDMVVVCKERRDAVSQSFIDGIRNLYPGTPLVALLGTWCEGEPRSGTPLRDVIPVWWHQWQGRYDQLAALAAAQGWAGLSATADATEQAAGPVRPGSAPRIAVSALSRTQFEMLADALAALGATACWIEEAAWQAEPVNGAIATCIDCDSISENLDRRIELVQSLCPDLPCLCVLGFPRRSELAGLQQRWGIRAFVSKPFDLLQLHEAIRQATGIVLPHQPVPMPPLLPGGGLSAAATGTVRS